MFTQKANKKYLLIALVTVLVVFCGLFAGLFGQLASVSTVAYAADKNYYTGTYQDSYYSGTYYNSLNEELQGTAFRTALANLITSTHSYNTTYDELMTVFKTSDADPDNPGKVILFYTGTTSTSYNREHVWPKDAGNAFPAKSEAGSDAHHLRPTDTQLNSTRGSLSFGETTDKVVKENGSTSYGNLCYTGGGFFCPGKGFRGQTARILFYVQTRWGNKYNLEFVDQAGNCKTIGKISTLLKWHLEEPPSESEIKRNEEIFKIQGNRNPFIDHPEYAEMIYCHDGKSYNAALQNVVKSYGSYLDEPTPIEGLTISSESLTLTVGATATLTTTSSPQGASNTVTWSTSNSSVATVSNGKVTAVGNGVATITATSVENTAIKASATVNVKTLTSLTINGTPTATLYSEGDAFDPSGLSVVGSYSDGSTENIDNSLCQWLDGVTGEKLLSKGTTSVICKMGDVTAKYEGILVRAIAGGTLTITRDDFNQMSSAYDWHDWSVGNISGSAYIYASTKMAMQFNTSRDYCHIFNSVALVGGVRTFTAKLLADRNPRDWELLTSDEPFAKNNESLENGTSWGIKTVTPDGATWEISTNHKYFAFVCTDDGATYLDSITINYGGAAVEDATCEHSFGDWIEGEPATCAKEGIQGHKICTLCGGTFDNEGEFIADVIITKLAHTEVEDAGTPATCSKPGLTAGSHCSVCDAVIVAQEVIPQGQHSFGDWTLTTAPTATTAGEETRTCAVCGETETRELTPDGKAFEFAEAVKALDANANANTKFVKISTCISLYNALSESEKQLVAEEYQTLIDFANAYNASAEAINVQHDNLAQSALLAFASTFGIFAALLFLLKLKA